MKTIYVSPHGNDQWSGLLADPTTDRQDGPFATPERARHYGRYQPRTATSIFGCSTPAYSTADYGVIQFD